MMSATSRSTLLLGLPLVGLVVGGLLHWAGAAAEAQWAWGLATAPILLVLLLQIISSLRDGKVGLDIVAALSMTAALVFRETLAGNVVAVMYAGGQLLENFAEGRAGREMTALLERVPRTAMQYHGDVLEEVPISEIDAGDQLLIRKGEVLPVDGSVSNGVALLDMSALTGEAIPVRLEVGGEVLSGTTLMGSAFTLTATHPASESTYAGIVRLVESARRSRAPMARLADRMAIWFLIVTVALAAAAWAVSQDPIRSLAVLVVATPCPLILAVPVAIISGMSRAASIGVLVKNGGVLEQLGKVRTAILDKTGTLTHGRAAVIGIRSVDGHQPDEILRLAASLDQASTHVAAEALVAAAVQRQLPLSSPSDVHELPGVGLEGDVDGKRVVVGGNTYVFSRSSGTDPRSLQDGFDAGVMTVAVAIDGKVAGVIALQDEIRPDAAAMLSDLRASGISRIVLASGDRSDVAAKVGATLKVDAVRSDLTPEDKVAVVAAERVNGGVLMVGDGINDAPALAAATVGVAMGARGAAASSEAAGIVLLIDRIDPLAKAIAIARRTRTIALQSVYIGIGLSLVGMVAAALGYLPPIQGALLQEAIDVAVILNALRALH
jgi:heavy metal translocating P-type ATPase